MSYRRFTDSAGTLWRVWEVVPAPLDRRLSMRRVRALKIHHPERRVVPDRRVDMARSRLYFPPTEPGWLCFEAGSNRRRLSPIPQHWQMHDEATLEEFCARAQAQAAPHPFASQPSE